MALSLTAGDLSRFEAATGHLVAPLAAPDAEAWGRSVLESLCELLGAESAFLSLPLDDGACFVTHDVDPRVMDGLRHFVVGPLSAGTPGPDPLIRVCARRRKRAGLRAMTYPVIDRLLGGALATSAFYNEVERDHGLHDCHVLAADVTREGRPATAAVHLYFGRSGRRPLGGGGLDALTVLAPAFQAGVESLRRLGHQRALLDSMDEAAVVFDDAGGTVHQSAALARVLRRDPERAGVVDEAQRLARRLRQPVRDGAAAPDRTVGTGAGRYRLRATRLPAGLFAAGSTTLVTVDAPADWRPAAADLRDRFGLTRREAEVALLLADGLANDAVAERLYISPHTARRHTERVMSKLGVASRAQVAATLLTPDRAA